MTLPKKILLVEDEPDLVKIMLIRLRSEGYDVVPALTGEDALEIIKNTKPDLILLDLHLPLISGEDVCKNIKSDESLRHIPVILFTAVTYKILDKIKETGADDYVTKPFYPGDLLEKVKKFIG